MQKKTSRNTRIGSSQLGGRRGLALILAAVGIGITSLPANSALADEGSIAQPSGSFTMSASFCSLRNADEGCEYWNHWGDWVFNSDGSITMESSDGDLSTNQASWTAVGPDQLFAETYSLEGCWLSSVLVERISGGTGGEYPCYEGIVDDLDIGVVALRLCLEP